MQEQIGRLTAKVTRMLRERQSLERENERLRAELQEATSAGDALREKCGRLEQQLHMLRAATGELDETGRKELEKQLKHYIREIDRCITLLGE